MPAKKATSDEELGELDVPAQGYAKVLGRPDEPDSLAECAKRGLPLVPLRRRGLIRGVHSGSSVHAAGAECYAMGNSKGVEVAVDVLDVDGASLCGAKACAALLLTREQARYALLGRKVTRAASLVHSAGGEVPWYRGDVLRCHTPGSSRVGGSGWLGLFHPNRARSALERGRTNAAALLTHLTSLPLDATDPAGAHEQAECRRLLTRLAQEVLTAAHDVVVPTGTLDADDRARLVGALLPVEAETTSALEVLGADAAAGRHEVHAAVRHALVQVGPRRLTAAAEAAAGAVDAAVPAAPLHLEALRALPAPSVPTDDPLGWLVSRWQEETRSALQAYAKDLLDDVEAEVAAWSRSVRPHLVLLDTRTRDPLVGEVVAASPTVSAPTGRVLALVHPLLGDVLTVGNLGPNREVHAQVVGEMPETGGDLAHEGSGASRGDVEALEVLGGIWTPGTNEATSDLAVALDMAVAVVRR